MTVEDTQEVQNNEPVPETGGESVKADIADALAQPSTEDEEMGAAWEKAMSDDGGEDRAEPAGDGRQRDPETGRFVAKDATEQETPDEGDQASLEGEGDAETDAGSTVAEVSAPAHMPQALKANWDKIPEDARKAIVDNDKEWSRKFGDMGRQLDQVRPVSEALAKTIENAPVFKGMTVEQIARGASELAAVQAKLQSADAGGRVDIIMQIANHAGVLPQLQAALSGQKLDEQDNAVFEKISGLEQKVSQITPDQIEQQVSRAIEMRDTMTAVEAFGSDPKNAFYADVEASLPQYIAIVKERHPEGISINAALAEAYDMAINADPNIRQKLREQEAKATSSQADTERAGKAKKAASINVKSTSNGKAPSMTEEQAMSAAYDRLMAT